MAKNAFKMGKMKKCIIVLMLLLSSCSVQKHIETGKQEVEDVKVETVETTDKNTVKYITITEYQTVYDTITKEYPVKSITHIKEENKDKIVTTSNEEKHIEAEEQVIEDNKTKSSASGYIWSFIAGCVVTLIITIFVRLCIRYIFK